MTAQSVAREAFLGAKTALPPAVAILPMGLAFGVLVSQSPLPWWAAPVFAAVIFAGTLEFLLIGLVTATAPLGVIAVTALLVNFRHVFYALSFPLHRVRGTGWRVLSTYILCDEAWALTSHQDARRWTGARILGLQSVFYVNWVLSALAGALAGSLVPPNIVGLDFAVTAFFVILGVDAYRVRRSVPVPLVALACGLGFVFLVGDAMILPAMITFVALLVASFGRGRWGKRRG